MYTINAPKHSSLVRAVTLESTDKESLITLRKFGIERARISELLKPLNITRVFVYRTVKLFLETGGVSDRKRSGWPRVVRTP